MIIRFVMLLILIQILSLNGIFQARVIYRLLTLWTLMLFIVYLILTCISYFQGRNYSQHDYTLMQLKNHWKFNQIIVVVFETVWNLEFVDSSVFLFVIVPLIIILGSGLRKIDIFFGIANHGIPLIFLLVDIFLSRVVFTPRHIVWSIGLGILFLIMDCICVCVFHNVAYPYALEWNNYISVVTICSAFALMVVGCYVGARFTRNNRKKVKEMLLFPETNPNFDNINTGLTEEMMIIPKSK